MNTKIPFVMAMIMLIVSNFTTSFIITIWHESNMSTALEADRACRPGIYKHILVQEHKAICVGGNNEEWVVKTK